MSDTGVRTDIEQWSKTESPEINSYIYSQLIFNKSTKTLQWENSLFKNSSPRYTPKRIENTSIEKLVHKFSQMMYSHTMEYYCIIESKGTKSLFKL